MPNTMFGNNLFFTSCVPIEFVEDGFQRMKSLMSYIIARHHHMVGTLDQTRQLQRSSKWASIGPVSLKMQEDLSYLMIDAY